MGSLDAASPPNFPTLPTPLDLEKMMKVFLLLSTFYLPSSLSLSLPPTHTSLFSPYPSHNSFLNIKNRRIFLVYAVVDLQHSQFSQFFRDYLLSNFPIRPPSSAFSYLRFYPYFHSSWKILSYRFVFYSTLSKSFEKKASVQSFRASSRLHSSPPRSLAISSFQFDQVAGLLPSEIRAFIRYICKKKAVRRLEAVSSTHLQNGENCPARSR